MSNLNIITVDDQLVVDSRLIAEELEIAHKSLRQTIEKYLNELQGFGTIAFETASSKMPDGRPNPKPERFCYLNEDQATLLMTMSRNTEKVVICKVNLVKAFKQAKNAITQLQGNNQQLTQEIEKLQLELALAKEQTKLSDSQMKLMATVQLLETLSPGLAPLVLGKADSIVERDLIVEKVIDRSRDRVTEGVTITELAKQMGCSNTKQAWSQLESIGYGKNSGHWESQLTAVESFKLPKDLAKKVIKMSPKGTRQLFFGE